MGETLRARANRLAVTLLTIAALAAAACGSTVPADQQQGAELASGGELGGVPTTTPTLPPGAHVNKKGQVVNAQGEVIGNAEDFGLSTGPSVAGGDSTGGVNAPSGGGGGTGGGGSSSAALGPGITPSKIYFGIAHIEAGAANNAAFGTPLDSDSRKPYNAMIEEVNKNGGILGREVVPLYFKFDANSAQTIDQQSQAACSYWTEDNEVFGILFDDANGLLAECAKRAGAIQLPQFGGRLPEDYERYPQMYEIEGLNLVRMGPVTVTGLDNQRYFGKEPKIGLITWDHDDFRATLERGFLPALKEEGLSPATPPAYATSPQQVNDLAATSADVNSAVLRFQSQGITHVMILDGSSGLCGEGCLTTLFLQRADKQEYLPRYGFNGRNVIKELQASGLVPERQLQRSVLVEWADFDESYDEGWRLNKARERCFAFMRKKGVPMENINQRATARFACEHFWFIQLVIAKMGGAALNWPNFTAGVNAIGWDFQSVSNYAAHFSARQHDGVAAARNAKFVNSCSCFEWSSDPYRV
jgi:hypothetical protein